MRWTSNDTQKSAQALFQEVTKARPGILKEVKLALMSENLFSTSSSKLEQVFDLSSPGNVKEVRDWWNGRCYTIDPSAKFGKFGIFEMRVRL